MEEFGIELRQRQDNSKPSMAFRKNGLISLNNKLAELMGIDQLTRIKLGKQDGEWFVFKVGKDEGGFTLRQKLKTIKGKNGQPDKNVIQEYVFSCSGLVKLFIEQNYKGYKGTVKVRVNDAEKTKEGDPNTKLYVILTSSFKIP